MKHMHNPITMRKTEHRSPEWIRKSVSFLRYPIILFCTILFFQGCTVNNVDLDESIGKYFDAQGAVGTFGMFDNSRGRFTIYDLDRFKKRYSPASTFKIVNALIGLQTGRLTSDSTVIPWDGITREKTEWNRDLSLYQAFRLSAVPHFQSLARQIGRDTMKFWIDSLKYGNMRIGKAVDSFWLDTTLLISPDEQLGLVKRLYFRQLPFRASIQEAVKKMMIRENNASYQLAYKTGMSQTGAGTTMAWMVGWIEENRHVYPFVLHLETDNKKGSDITQVREKILKDILAHIGFFKGKM
jgi:beta-lactamase class D